MSSEISNEVGSEEATDGKLVAKAFLGTDPIPGGEFLSNGSIWSGSGSLVYLSVTFNPNSAKVNCPIWMICSPTIQVPSADQKLLQKSRTVRLIGRKWFTCP